MSNLTLVGVSLGLLVGCSGSPSPVSTPSPTPAPLATTEPVDSFRADLQLFADLTARYEAPLEKEENGYPIVEPLLKGDLPEGLGEDLYEVGLETSEERRAFDGKLLPVLEEAFSKPVFLPPGRLVVGESEVNYRGLRHLVTLLGRRAEQLWSEGDKERALALAGLPISLSRAMRQRPETASVNLFSSSYAETTLDLLTTWLEAGALDESSLERLHAILESGSPEFSHLRETVSVDFAQLLNSLATPEGRERLGIGRVEESRVETWRRELLEIHREAIELYGDTPVDAAAFNRTVLAASSPIQGLVIDYPEVATMQKHAFARYKASEWGLGVVLAGEGDDLATLPLEGEAETFLNVAVDGGTVRISGEPGQFEMLAPGVEPVFFEYNRADLESR